MVVCRFTGINTIISPNLPIIDLPPQPLEIQQRVCYPLGDHYHPPPLYRYAKATQNPLNRLCDHLWEPKASFWCVLKISTLLLCFLMYWLSLEPPPLQLVMLFRKFPPHHPLRQSKSSATWQIENYRNDCGTTADTVFPCLVNWISSTPFPR